jgi:hypothetical protein
MSEQNGCWKKIVWKNPYLVVRELMNTVPLRLSFSKLIITGRVIPGYYKRNRHFQRFIEIEVLLDTGAWPRQDCATAVVMRCFSSFTLKRTFVI